MVTDLRAGDSLTIFLFSSLSLSLDERHVVAVGPRSFRFRVPKSTSYFTHRLSHVGRAINALLRGQRDLERGARVDSRREARQRVGELATVIYPRGDRSAGTIKGNGSVTLARGYLYVQSPATVRLDTLIRLENCPGRYVKRSQLKDSASHDRQSQFTILCVIFRENRRLTSLHNSSGIDEDARDIGGWRSTTGIRISRPPVESREPVVDPFSRVQGVSVELEAADEQSEIT